jgi:CRISPR system Cascade subunit CasC
LQKELESLGVPEAIKISQAVANFFGKTEEKSGDKTKNLLYLSPGDIKAIAEKISNKKEELITFNKDKTIDVKKGLLRDVLVTDRADITFFGRFIAQDPTASIESASSFSHPLSVHKIRNETDFFAAISDEKEEGETGAAYINENYYNSATYYSAIGINTSLLEENSHLGNIPIPLRREILSKFIESCIMANPGAKQSTMFSRGLPYFVFANVRENSQSYTLADAFEKPIRSSDGYNEEAVRVLMGEWEIKKRMFKRQLGDIKLEASFSKNGNFTLDTFCEEIIKNVW